MRVLGLGPDRREEFGRPINRLTFAHPNSRDCAEAEAEIRAFSQTIAAEVDQRLADPREDGISALIAFRRDAFTAKFLGDANLFVGKPEAGGLRLADGALIEGVRQGTIAVRPENIRITENEPDTPNRLCAVLRQRIFGGAIGTCLLHWQGTHIKAVARDVDFLGLPDAGPVRISWPADYTIEIENATAVAEPLGSVGPKRRRKRACIKSPARNHRRTAMAASSSPTIPWVPRPVP